MNFDLNNPEVIKKIEKALGFSLYRWQRRYLSLENMKINPDYRSCGNSTIFIVKQLLTLDRKLNLTWASNDIELLIDHNSKDKNMQKLMKPMIETIDYKLKSVGFETCLIRPKKQSEMVINLTVDGLDETLKKVEKYCKLINEAAIKLEQAEEISKKLKNAEFKVNLKE